MATDHLITDDELISQFPFTQCPVCGAKDEPQQFRSAFKKISHCIECESYMIVDEDTGEPVHPDTLLKTSKSGIFEYTSNYYQHLLVLFEMTSRVPDHLDVTTIKQARNIYGDIFLYAENNVVIGYLIEDGGVTEDDLQGFAIAPHYQQNGYGTEFITDWFENSNHNELVISCFPDVEEFYDQLPFSVQY